MKKHQNKFSKALALMLTVVMALSVVLATPVDTQAAAKKFVKKLSVAKKSVTVDVGKKVTVKATVNANSKFKPTDGVFKVTVKSSDKTVATAKVAKLKGKKKAKSASPVITITGKKAGKAKITVTTKSKNKKKKTLSKTITVTVKGAKTDDGDGGGNGNGNGNGNGDNGGGTTQTEDVYALNKTALNMTTGNFETVNVTVNGNAYIGLSSTITWESSNPDVVSVSPLYNQPKAVVMAQYNGSATITATVKLKDGTVKKVSAPVTVAGDCFDVNKDLTIEYDDTVIHIDFDMKKKAGQTAAEYAAEVKELIQEGCTVKDLHLDSDGNIRDTSDEIVPDEKIKSPLNVQKDQICETAKYTFTKLPRTTGEIKNLFTKEEKDWTVSSKKTGKPNYGGFTAMAATICAAKFMGDNPIIGVDPNGSDNPNQASFDYINGADYGVSKTDWSTALGSVKNATSSFKMNPYTCYFQGAKPTNSYKPDTPYVLWMYKGPYYIQGTERFTGYRPTTYMILIPGAKSNFNKDKNGNDVTTKGFDSDRYIDVYGKVDEGHWCSFDDNFKHITASGIKALQSSGGYLD